MTNLQANFSIGNQSWDESDIGFKYGISTIWLVREPDGDVWVDDGEDGSGDTGILFFDNGSSTLYIDEGDLDERTYSVDSTVSGTYSINLALPGTTAIPVMPSLAIALMALMLGALGVFYSRKRSI
jgi:hypothetical protein